MLSLFPFALLLSVLFDFPFNLHKDIRLHVSMKLSNHNKSVKFSCQEQYNINMSSPRIVKKQVLMFYNAKIIVTLFRLQM